MPRTLRGRLIAGLVALLAAACATVGLVTYFAVQGALSRELNSQLQTATQLTYNCWRDPGNGDQPSARQQGAASTSAATDDPMSNGCNGIGEGTFVAIIPQSGQCRGWMIGKTWSPITLTAADEDSLLSIPPGQNPPSPNTPAQTVTRYVAGKGTYLLTAVQDGDGSVYITGLPLSTMHDELKRVALAEAAVFAVVLVLAGVLGTIWVRFSLRPLRRVAATAAHVAELPLETGEISLPAGVLYSDPATETGQVGLAFNRMLGHVENALQRRAASEARLRRFAADASHELRTPLAAIRGYAELALRRPGDSPDEVTHALGRVLSESKRMSVLVEDLLLLARLDAGRPLSSDPVDLTMIAIEATSDAQAARPGHRWLLELPDDPVLALGDEGRLRQVLVNLLSNAGRHTPDGTTVTVALGSTLPDDEPGAQAQAASIHSVSHGTIPAAPRAVLTVTDNGPGIPADLLPDLFERFTRADTARSHTANASSTGLGLAIVDAVVAAHQGAILVTSRAGMTRFTIVLAQLAEPAEDEPSFLSPEEAAEL